MANATAVTTGPGLLYVAPVGTTEPLTASAALPSAWRTVGYTEEGTTVSNNITNEGVEVAEEFYPLRYYTTSAEASVAFQMAEADRRNLALALNAGAAAANDGTSFEPPAPNTEVRVMITLQADTGARWVFRQCLQADNVEIAFHKAPDKKLIPVSFRLEKPTGLAPFIVFPATDGRI